MILKSATRIVLIIMTLAFIGLTFKGIIQGTDFVNAMLMILSFYFGQKNGQSETSGYNGSNSNSNV